MGEMGLRYHQSEIAQAMDYTTRMIEDGRVIIITSHGEPVSIMFISLTNSPDNYLKKENWEYLTHDAHGECVYIEKIISRKWNREIRNLIESELSSRYPSFTYAVWHRWAKWGDRKVTIKRRINHVRN